MNRYKLLAGILLISTFAMAMPGKSPVPSSAMEFQALSTDTRIAVEAGYLRFFTGNTERLTVDASGKLGIGTATPSYAMHLVLSEASQFRIDYGTVAAKVGVNSSGGFLSATDDNGDVAVTLKGYGDSYISNSKLAIGSTDPGNYELNVNGAIMAATSMDIGDSRPTGSDPDGLNLSISSDSRTSVQLATGSWSNSHALLFGAYKSATQLSGNLAYTGNTKFAADAGSYNFGAAMIHFYGNAGGMGFYISGASTGADADIDWGTPKLQLKRDGSVGINQFDPTEKLHVSEGNLLVDKDTGSDTIDPTTITIKSTSVGSAWDQSQTWGNLDFYSEDGSGPGSGVRARIGAFMHTTTGGSTGLTFSTASSSGGLTENMRIKPNGNVGIGTTDPTYTLEVVGEIHGTNFSADSPPSWPDYVFADSYVLTDLKEVEKFIESNHHLPEVPSEADVKENGVNLVEMQAKLLQKIEELTLYVIEQNKRIEAQEAEIVKFKTQMTKLESGN